MARYTAALHHATKREARHFLVKQKEKEEEEIITQVLHFSLEYASVE